LRLSKIFFDIVVRFSLEIDEKMKRGGPYPPVYVYGWMRSPLFSSLVDEFRTLRWSEFKKEVPKSLID